MNAQVNESNNETSLHTSATDTAKRAPATLDDMRNVIRIEDKLAETVGPILESIRQHSAKMIEAKNAKDAGDTERGALWADTLRIVGLVAPEVAKTPRIAEWVFNELVRPVMPEEGEKSNTVKVYMSTGRNVLVKLILGEKKPLESLQEKSYADVRKMLRPAGNQAADAMRDLARERIAFIAKYADKFGNDADNNAESRLTAILDAIEPHYNAVKSAKDSTSAAAKAAKELADNRQSAPAEPATVETVQKPEAPRQAA